MILLPKPRQMELREGVFQIGLQTCIVLGDAQNETIRTAAKQLQADIAAYAGLHAALQGDGLRAGDILLDIDAGQADSQGYRLTVDGGGAHVAGGGEAGLLHGVQTLRQMIRQQACVLPALRIEDAPVYPVRGFYHDVSRGRVPTLASLKRLADEACLFKLNHLQLYIEHTFLFRGMSEVSRATTPLTADEILELDAYCASLGIDLVPSLSSFGHLFDLLNGKEYGHLRELSEALPFGFINRMSHHTLDASNPQSFALAAEMIRSFAKLFRSRYFNICSDETFDLGKDRSREALEKNGERDYYISFVKKLCECVIDIGRIPMFWGDIVLHFPDALAELPPQTICLNWGYDAMQTEESTRAIAMTGARQYACPGVCGWNEWMCCLRNGYMNISRMARYGKAHGAIGFLNTDWGDYGHINDPRFSLPGLVYGAVCAWQEEEPAFERLNSDISRLVYGDRGGQVLRHLNALQEQQVYSWRELVGYAECQMGSSDAGTAALTPNQGGRIEQSEAALAEISRALADCIREMDSAHRHLMQPWSVALEAIAVWNLTGDRIANGRTDAAVARRLEQWFYLYACEWRNISKESELYHIRDVVFFYADRLRP